MNDIVTAEDRIAGKIDTKVAGTLQVSSTAGGVLFANASEVMEFAKMMSIADIAVPKHLRRSPGACLGIVLQSIEWKMSPFSVANKSYLVNDRLAYEAQLIHAVALQRAPIKGRIKFDFLGVGQDRHCRAWAHINNGDELVEYVSPKLSEILVKNSPLWKSDPDQQLTYYSVRALCRRHFPDVLMGIYAPDEFDTVGARTGARSDLPDFSATPRGENNARDVTPKKTLAERLDALGASHQSHTLYTGPPESAPTQEEASAILHKKEEDRIAKLEAERADAAHSRSSDLVHSMHKAYKEARHEEINVPDVPEWAAQKIEDALEPLTDAAAQMSTTRYVEAEARTQDLFAQAKARATGGTIALTQWLYDLSTPDYDILKERLDPILERAKKADKATGGKK